MADNKTDLMRQALKNLLDERDLCIQALATDYSQERLTERLEKLAKVQFGIDIVRKDIGPSR
jgi:hypothetical protein